MQCLFHTLEFHLPCSQCWFWVAAIGVHSHFLLIKLPCISTQIFKQILGRYPVVCCVCTHNREYCTVFFSVLWVCFIVASVLLLQVATPSTIFVADFLLASISNYFFTLLFEMNLRRFLILPFTLIQKKN